MQYTDYEIIEEIQNKYYERIFTMNIVAIFDGLFLTLKEWNLLAITLEKMDKYQNHAKL
jgi:hypothetical protein